MLDITGYNKGVILLFELVCSLTIKIVIEEAQSTNTQITPSNLVKNIV